jgi:hypothetical protein
MKIRVLKRFGQWHWWCPECMGGDWYPMIQTAWAEGLAHLRHRHSGDSAA